MAFNEDSEGGTFSSTNNVTIVAGDANGTKLVKNVVIHNLDNANHTVIIEFVKKSARLPDVQCHSCTRRYAGAGFYPCLAECKLYPTCKAWRSGHNSTASLWYICTGELMAVRVIQSSGRRAGLPGKRANIYTVQKYGGMLFDDHPIGLVVYRSCHADNCCQHMGTCCI